MSKRLRVCWLWVFAANLAIMSSGCSREKESAGIAATEASSSQASSASGGSIQPCKLLTAAQVATAIPNPSAGFVANAGGSLIEGVDAYQCSYTNDAANVLTVILNVAVDDARFEKIKPSPSLHSDHREIGIGDAAWLYGDENDAKVEVVKGRTIIDLELRAPGATGKSEALMELARLVVQQIQ
jgi:hypothetical protein